LQIVRLLVEPQDVTDPGEKNAVIRNVLVVALGLKTRTVW